MDLNLRTKSMKLLGKKNMGINFCNLVLGKTFLNAILKTQAMKEKQINSAQSVQSLSHIRVFATPWTAACQVSLSITNSQSLLKLMSIRLVMPSNYLILCRLFLLLPSIFPNIRVFSNESVLCIRWPKYWSFSFNISPSDNTQD